MKKTNLEKIPSKIKKEVEDRDNLSSNPHQTSCVICAMLGVENNLYWRNENKYEIAHFRTRNTSDSMRTENLVVMCKQHHRLQHTDLLEGRKIKDMMASYLSRKHPNYYEINDCN